MLPSTGLVASEAFAAPRPTLPPKIATLVRYDVNSVQGQKMLAIYHDAVNVMMRTSAKDPCSWTFQWYTHFVKGSTTKSAELIAIYGAGSSPQKTLATTVWDTCQAHMGPPEDEMAFLPWHRMFVYFFESMIRRISKQPSFTLPYWNYSASSTAAMPAAFRTVGSPLYRSSRNAGSNGGGAIPASQVALTALGETTYGPNGAASGFDQAIDFGIHGNVHVWVGNNVGMGAVPWAGNDPIFWMHHCNIDRLWASWNKAGRVNPGGAWLAEEFTFANANCEAVRIKNGDVDQISKLHYTYDRFEPVPGAAAPLAAQGPRLHLESVMPPVSGSSAAGPIQLGAQGTRVELRAAATPNGPTFAARMSALPAETKVYLVLRDSAAAAQPGVVYDVYLDSPAGAIPSSDDPHHVGTINFFSASGMAGMMGGVPRTFSLDITAALRRLTAQNTLSANPAVLIVPSGQPDAAAQAVIGQIQIIEQ